jgi:hypothetical protein
VTTKEPANYDDTTFDPIEDPEAGKVSTGTRRRRRSVWEKKRILIIWCG